MSGALQAISIGKIFSAPPKADTWSNLRKFYSEKAQRSQALEFIFVIKFDKTRALPTTHLMLSRYIYALATKDAPFVRRTLSNADIICATRTRNKGIDG